MASPKYLPALGGGTSVVRAGGFHGQFELKEELGKGAFSVVRITPPPPPKRQDLVYWSVYKGVQNNTCLPFSKYTATACVLLLHSLNFERCTRILIKIR